MDVDKGEVRIWLAVAVVVLVVVGYAAWLIRGKSAPEKQVEGPRDSIGVKMGMDLYNETRWSRHYKSPDGKRGYRESKFMDGSASITLGQLQVEWPSWNASERLDFIYVCCGA